MEIRQGYKQTEVGIIPEEWEVKKLGECFEFLSTNSYSREKMTYEEQEYMNIHYGDIHMKYGATLDIEKMKRKIPYIKAEETLPKKIILVKEGDLLVADASEDYKDIGKSTEILNIKDNKVLGGLHTLLLRDKNNSFANGYKGYILRNEKISKEVKRIATGISVLGISKTNLSELNIPIPPLKEQEKIAEILSYYDKAIEQQELLIEKEKEFKKGMMQKIFSQEIRFKDDNGEDYPEWEEKRLEDIYTFQYGQYNTNPNNGGQYPIYGANGIIGGYTNYNAERSVIIGHMGAYAGSVLWEERKHFVTYNGTITKPKNEKELDSKYGYYLLVNMKIMRICAGSGQPFLSYEILNKLKTKCSHILEEQKKITVFLSNLDNKIELLEDKLELLKNEKKGMMQKLLTGEVRV